MNREERLTFADVLIGCIRENLLDVPGDSRLNVRKPCFVNGDCSGRMDFVLHLFSLNQSKLDAYGLQSFGGELDGREGSLCRRGCRTGRTALCWLRGNTWRGTGKGLRCGRPSRLPPDSSQHADEDN